MRDCGERGVDTHIFSTFAGYSREEYSQVVQDPAECWHRQLSVGTDKASIVDSQFTAAAFSKRCFRNTV